MDQDRKWKEYRSVLDNHTSLLTKKEQQQEPFLCFYEEPEGGKYEGHTGHTPPIVIMEKMTSTGNFMIWFALPLTAICVCWLAIVFVCLWYFCPPERGRRPGGGQYHDPESMKGALSPFSGGEGMEVGKMPMVGSGGAAACGAC